MALAAFLHTMAAKSFYHTTGTWVLHLSASTICYAVGFVSKLLQGHLNRLVTYPAIGHLKSEIAGIAGFFPF